MTIYKVDGTRQHQRNERKKCYCDLCRQRQRDAMRARRADRPRRPSPTERFWSRVDKTDGCWLWTATLTTSGYGQVWWDGRLQHTHRVAYMLEVDPIPEGLSILHRCDVRACVRPDHLFAGTQQENMADMKAKGRGRGALGPRNHNTRLTYEQVEEIRRRYAERQPGDIALIAAEFGITKQYVCQLGAGRWRRHGQ